MGVYNEKASLISAIVKISLILLMICLFSATKTLSTYDNNTTKTVEYIATSSNDNSETNI